MGLIHETPDTRQHVLFHFIALYKRVDKQHQKVKKKSFQFLCTVHYRTFVLMLLKSSHPYSKFSPKLALHPPIHFLNFQYTLLSTPQTFCTPSYPLPKLSVHPPNHSPNFRYTLLTTPQTFCTPSYFHFLNFLYTLSLLSTPHPCSTLSYLLPTVQCNSKY